MCFFDDDILHGLESILECVVTQVGSDIYEFYEVERNAKEFDIITFVRWIEEKRKGSYMNKCYPI